jgi:predicted porin
MKKVLIALTLAVAGVASAQVTISGKIGQYMDNTKTGTADAAGTIGAEATNNIAFKAVEDLGGGLKANVVVETRLRTSDPTAADSQLGDRQSTVGLSSKLGSINLGRNTHSVFGTLANTDVFNAFYGSINSDIHNQRGLRFSNGVFTQVNPMENVSLSFERQQLAAGTEASGYGVNAALAGVNLSLARYESGTSKSDVVGVGTNVMGVKLGLLYSEDATGTVTTKGTSLGAAYKIYGPVTAKASYGSQTGAVAGDVRAYNAGLDYEFSKRTVAQVIYRKVENPGVSTDVRQVAVGMVHRF